jgi:hypothetical protein
MTGLPGSGAVVPGAVVAGPVAARTGRRAARTAAPRLLTSSRWRTSQRALTLLIAGSAAMVGIQLGLTGPLTSPVQPTDPVAGAPVTTGDAPQAPLRSDQRVDVGRGRGNRGDGGRR